VQLLRPEVARQVLEWMETVVQKGSGKGARIPGYRIGGKTGTAQKALNGVYIPGARICSFIANLTTDNPRYVVLVVVDEPQGGNAYGSTVAVPVAKQIIEALLVLEKLPPQAAAQQLGLRTLCRCPAPFRIQAGVGGKPGSGKSRVRQASDDGQFRRPCPNGSGLNRLSTTSPGQLGSELVFRSRPHGHSHKQVRAGLVSPTLSLASLTESTGLCRRPPKPTPWPICSTNSPP
jgi:membrane peptidoglycan carboxypeptidase